jgi:hypothetical protein
VEERRRGGEEERRGDYVNECPLPPTRSKQPNNISK